MAKKAAASKVKSEAKSEAKPGKIKDKASSAKATKPAKASAAAKPPPVPKPPKPPKAPKAEKPTPEQKAEKKALDKKAKAVAAAVKAATEETQKWLEIKNKHDAEKALPYSMNGIFETNTPIQHKVLGWGYIMNVQNDRLEVIFEHGTKILISNYKPN